MQNTVNSFVPIFIGTLPIVQHLADKGLDYLLETGQTKTQRLREAIGAEGSRTVASIAKSEPLFIRLATYFENMHRANFILSLFYFNAFSLIAALFEYQQTVVTVLLQISGILALFLGIFAFSKLMAAGRFEMAAIDPLRQWNRAAVIAFMLILALEAYLHASTEI